MFNKQLALKTTAQIPTTLHFKNVSNIDICLQNTALSLWPNTVTTDLG